MDAEVTNQLCCFISVHRLTGYVEQMMFIPDRSALLP
jgi:hypothetical protein